MGNNIGARHKTPILRRPRKKGGTLYVFPSATEDIGLNLNERRNKVTLTHYALLNIPVSDNLYQIDSLTDNYDSQEESKNRFNLTNIPGHYKNEVNSVNDSAPVPSKLLASSLQNYAFNFETVLRNQETYDYSNPVTVSERVFWKWLKETGAIRWVYDRASNSFVEEPEVEILENGEKKITGYNRVVQCIGEIKSGSNTYDTYGVFNETYVNIPSSYGGSVQYFKQYIDNNYQLGTAYSAKDTIEGLDPDYDIPENNDRSDVLFSDGNPYTDITADAKINGTFSTARNSVTPWWYGLNIKNFPDAHDRYDSVLNAYITDPLIEKDSLSSTTSGALFNNIFYSAKDFNAAGQQVQSDRVFKRSTIDSISLVTDINEIRQIYGANQPDLLKQEGLSPLNLSYDDIAIDLADKTEFEFNTVLIYYSIFDQSGQNIIATNLFGVLFLEAPVDDRDEADKTGAITKFHLPVYKKIKSDSTGFGTSYSLRVNIKTFDVYDNTDAVIKDRTTNASLIEANFNSVLYNLTKSIDILQRSVDTNSFIKSQYEEFNNKANKILRDNIELKKFYDNIIKSERAFIKTKHLIADDVTCNTYLYSPENATADEKPKIEFHVSQKDPNFNERFLRDLTEEEAKYIDKTRVDLKIEPNQASSYRFDAHENAAKDHWQKLEYTGELLETNSEDIIKKIKEQKNLVSKLDPTEDYEDLAGDDTYILNLVRNQLDVKFAESINPIDTSVDSIIDLNSKTYRNVSAYVNHKIPELIISPASKAFNDETGLVPELLKYSKNKTVDNEKQTDAEINYVKLIPYIIKVIQMIDPKYFVSQSSIKITSDQVPNLEDRKTTICMDADATMADKSVKTADDNSDRLSFKIKVRRGNLTIKMHYPVFETANIDKWNQFKDRLVTYIGAVNDGSVTVNISNLEPRECATLIVLSYLCKDRMYHGLTDDNKIILDTNRKLAITDEDTFILANISWVWYNFDNNQRLTALNKDATASERIDAITGYLMSHKGFMETDFRGLKYYFDGIPSKEEPSEITSSFSSPAGLYFTNTIYKNEENGVAETVNFTPYIEIFNGFGPDPRQNNGLYHDNSRYSYVEFILSSGDVNTDDSGEVTATTNQKSVTFSIRQRPNIKATTNTGNNNTIIYNTAGNKAYKTANGLTTEVDPEITVEAAGTLADSDKKHRIKFSHSSDESKTITVSFDDDGTVESDPKNKLVK